MERNNLIVFNQWMDNENMVHIYYVFLFGYKEKWKHTLCRWMDETRKDCIQWDNTDQERQLFYVLSFGGT